MRDSVHFDGLYYRLYIDGIFRGKYLKRDKALAIHTNLMRNK